jgi:hypothetical protein
LNSRQIIVDYQDWLHPFPIHVSILKITEQLVGTLASTAPSKEPYSRSYLDITSSNPLFSGNAISQGCRHSKWASVAMHASFFSSAVISDSSVCLKGGDPRQPMGTQETHKPLGMLPVYHRWANN